MGCSRQFLGGTWFWLGTIITRPSAPSHLVEIVHGHFAMLFCLDPSHSIQCHVTVVFAHPTFSIERHPVSETSLHNIKINGQKFL
ncbi:hypothetical protein MtrunA17_Chr8g0357461 [Medicago truncatula]|uniref:Uncharacterized protein n=1 Tax=Medicago truncatula TaxID=3880 RepID=A0A396GJH1_MEDTR|nr:hypothetical protein MtrunA17_Chr8g0357461 [Medicago truncatula]